MASGVEPAGIKAQSWTAPPVRMVADDLTGALDSAAQFASEASPLTVTWSVASVAVGGSLVIDTGNRERTPSDARDRFAQFVDALAPIAGTISYLKLDSLLRGHAGAEIAACAQRWPGRSIIVAPAMPYQGRITRGGRQILARGCSAEPIGEDIAASLAIAGVEVAHQPSGSAIPSSVSLWDAESDDDLHRIATMGASLSEPPLWCGSAGLAGVLAHLHGSRARPTSLPISSPLLGIFGTDHPVMQAQLLQAGTAVTAMADATALTARAVNEQLHSRGIALLTFKLSVSTDRRDARRRIYEITQDLLPQLDPPAALVISGGETLRGVCEALDAARLIVDGQIEPGAPYSRLDGGRWNGARVVSKSGAFGKPDFLNRLIISARGPQRSSNR